MKNLLERGKNLMKRGKVLVCAAVAAVSSMAVGICACAEDGGTANQAVVSAMTTTAKDMVATGTAIIPIALTVIGLSMVVVFGIRIFKKVSNKG